MEKTYKIYSGGWQVQSGYPIRFVYDGWNVVLVLNGNNETVRKYTWGLDLSQFIHGAGGIGGLLACEEPLAPGGPKRYWFMYDANGNVGQVLDATDTGSITIAARYEYDPYGNPIPIPQPPGPGPYADLNPIRFSTKWFDRDFGTDLGYWGYRSYSPPLGRWISRDPINEPGAALIHHEPEVATLPPLDLGGTIDLEANLQRFVGNDPSNIVDALGLWGRETHWGDPDQQRVRGTYDIAIDIGFSDRCARVLADWNQGVDDVTPAFLYPYYHFEPGRFAIAVDRWRTGVDKLRRANVYWSPWIWDVSVYDGLAHIGEALHGYQDSFAHIATHHADTPLRHVTGPNSGRYTVPTRFYRAGDSLANRPDDPDLFPDDHNSTVADTDIRLRQIWRIRSVQCHCR